MTTTVSRTARLSQPRRHRSTTPLIGRDLVSDRPHSPSGHWSLYTSRATRVFLVLSPPWGRELERGGTWHADNEPLPLIRPSATFSPRGGSAAFNCWFFNGLRARTEPDSNLIGNFAALVFSIFFFSHRATEAQRRAKTTASQTRFHASPCLCGSVRKHFLDRTSPISSAWQKSRKLWLAGDVVDPNANGDLTTARPPWGRRWPKAG